MIVFFRRGIEAQVYSCIIFVSLTIILFLSLYIFLYVPSLYLSLSLSLSLFSIFRCLSFNGFLFSLNPNLFTLFFQYISVSRAFSFSLFHSHYLCLRDVFSLSRSVSIGKTKRQTNRKNVCNMIQQHIFQLRRRYSWQKL